MFEDNNEELKSVLVSVAHMIETPKGIMNSFVFVIHVENLPGLRTVTPSASKILAKPSNSFAAFTMRSEGNEFPALCLNRFQCLLGQTAFPETCHSGIVASATQPTITSRNGSNSLWLFTGQPRTSVAGDSTGLTIYSSVSPLGTGAGLGAVDFDL